MMSRDSSLASDLVKAKIEDRSFIPIISQTGTPKNLKTVSNQSESLGDQFITSRIALMNSTWL